MRHVAGRPDGGDTGSAVMEMRKDGNACAALVLMAAMTVWPLAAQPPGQTSPAAEQSAQTTKPNTEQDASSKGAAPVAVKPDTTQVSAKDRRLAGKLYLEASKLFEKGQFEQALHDYQEAAQLVPDNRDYNLAAQVARSHAVTALIQAAARAHTRGDAAASRADLVRAQELDPKNPEVAEHMNVLADDVLRGQMPSSLYDDTSSQLASEPRLEPKPGTLSFHLKTDSRQLILQVYRAFGIDASVDQSVPATQVRFDIDNVAFADAVRVLGLVTGTFSVELDAHRVVVAKDTRQNREQFQREEVETIYLPGLSQEQMTEVTNVAKNVFATSQLAVNQDLSTVTVRAPSETLDAFNATMQNLMEQEPEVVLDVQIIQLAHTGTRNLGVQLPQQFTTFNVYAEEQSILNANQSLVQEIISSGLASPSDTLAILGILLASGQVSNSIFSNGFALFGGGLTLSGVSPGPTTVNLALNSSDSRELDNIRLRLADDKPETLMSGTHYPIMTASYQGLATSGYNIAGLTSAGTSSGLTALLSQISGQTPQIPQVQYQDLGLTLKVTPKTMRSGDVALTLDLKITALQGTSLNGIPVLNNRSYSGVITLKEGVGAVMMGELDKQETYALSGTPGLSEIPGLNNVTDKEVEQDYSTLLIALTPHLVHGPKFEGHSPMMRIVRTSQMQ